MSDMYAIKTSTLTALGDAVRVKLNKSSEKYENINLIGANLQETISSEITAPQYKCILNNAVITRVSDKDILFEIYEEEILGKRIYYTYHLKEESFPIEIISSNPNIFLYYRASGGDSLSFDLTIIPLDENGEEYKYTPLEMANALNEIEIPVIEPVVLTGSQGYGCSGALSSMFVKSFPDKVTTKDLTGISYLFNGYQNESIPFEINCKIGTQQSASYLFYTSYYLKNLPKINNLKPTELSNIFGSCWSLREIPEDIDATWDWSYVENQTSAYNAARAYTFYQCYSLRKVPMSFLNHINRNGTYSYSIYYSAFSYCYSLDEIIGLPIPFHENGTDWTSNAFSSIVDNCSRLKDFTFETYEDGKPIGDSSHTAVKVPWRNQTIDLSKNVGYAGSYSSSITNYNSGITKDKEVTDDATYQALKNDDDWFTSKVEYSRYNHDSAVRTINSLPACLDTAQNIIKFKGAAGALTDGGAINTLTSTEIAVASKKGWTVTLV